VFILTFIIFCSILIWLALLLSTESKSSIFTGHSIFVLCRVLSASKSCPQGVHRQCSQIPALATRLEQGPVRYGGPVTHWPFSVAGRLSSPDRAPELRHLSILQRRWRDGRAPGPPLSSTWPGQGHLAGRTVQHGPTTPLGFLERIGAVTCPPDREWEREREQIL